MVVHRTPTPVMYRLVAAVLRPAVRAILRYEVSGLEHVPESGGVIVTPNHISHIDVLPWADVLYDRGRAPVFLAKASLFEMPVVGAVMRRTKQVRVDRETASAGGSLAEAERALEAGECVGIYPEGSLTRDPDQWPMRGKTGAARLALRTGHPVVPLALWGAQDALPPYARVPRVSRRRTRVLIRFGPPVDLSDLRADPVTSRSVEVATDRIMAAITHELEELRGASAPPERFDPKAHGLPTMGDYRPGGSP